MSISWDYDDRDGYDASARYQAELDAADRQRMREGWQPVEGWRRPVEPVCPRCLYVIVDGACAGCPERAARVREACSQVEAKAAIDFVRDVREEEAA